MRIIKVQHTAQHMPPKKSCERGACTFDTVNAIVVVGAGGGALGAHAIACKRRRCRNVAYTRMCRVCVFVAFERYQHLYNKSLRIISGFRFDFAIAYSMMMMIRMFHVFFFVCCAGSVVGTWK